MKKMLLGAIAVVLVAGCSRPAQEESKPGAGAPSKAQVSLMKGAGNWVIFKEEMSMDSLIDKTIDQPYQTSGVVVSGAPPLKRMRVTLRPTPLNPNDRCGLEVVAVTAVTNDGQEFTAPAVGHVTDNSDGLIGMRIEVSRNAGSGLVIPANATGTVIFDQDVILPLNP